MPKTKKRLDVLLVDRGLFPTRSQAQAAVMAGQVLADGAPATKAGATFAEGVVLELLKPACPYVSRGGLKLKAALEAFKPVVAGRVTLDVGASTGGFTDCLLQAGAAKVYAVDVGTAQLSDKLKADPRVVSRENTHARDLTPEWFEPKPDLAAVDVSFISLTQVLPFVFPCLKAPFEIIALIKPQFELGPKLAPKGVVKKPEHRLLAVEKIREAAAAWPVEEKGLIDCPVHGPKGNIEFLIHWIGT